MKVRQQISTIPTSATNRRTPSQVWATSPYPTAKDSDLRQAQVKGGYNLIVRHRARQSCTIWGIDNLPTEFGHGMTNVGRDATIRL